MWVLLIHAKGSVDVAGCFLRHAALCVLSHAALCDASSLLDDSDLVVAVPGGHCRTCAGHQQNIEDPDDDDDDLWSSHGGKTSLVFANASPRWQA